MATYFSSDVKLGILGGGQLGKMLWAVAQKYDINTFILDPSENAPCAKICPTFQKGNLLNKKQVFEFGKKVDILTIEIEHVNVGALYELEKIGVKIFPQPHLIALIQNKYQQKKFYQENQIPTAACSFFENIKMLLKNPPPFPFIWKSTHFGYDGMGVKCIHSKEDLESLSKKFLKNSCITEEKIDFQKEIAVIVARNKKGNIVNYPVVAMVFHPDAHQLEYLVCPADIPENTKKEAVKIAKKIVKKMKYVGLLAVEMFITKDNTILVNEIAPRVHNSGHHTIESNYTNQFEQHLRAILGMPLGNCDLKSASVMCNLVGDSDSKGAVFYENIEKILEEKDVYLHLYGKKETKPFRKMGHFTVLKKNTNEALDIAKKIKQQIKVKGNQKIKP